MPESKRRRWPWILVSALLVVLSVVLAVAAMVGLGSWGALPTRVLIVNAGPAPLLGVSFRVECDGREAGTFDAPAFAPGDAWEVDVTRTGKMPWTTLSWHEGAREIRHREQTDLWVGETWRIELLPGGRVRSGYWSDEGGWVTESERPAGVFPP